MKRVVAIGLDSADAALLSKWIDAGALPEIAALMKASAHGRLNGTSGYTAETPWTTVLTGCWPKTTGYWTPLKYSPDYRVEEVQAYDYQEIGPFYAYFGARRVVAFDVPHARASARANGAQILAWGAHSPQGPSESVPTPLLGDIVREFGAHPTLRADDILIGETHKHGRALEAQLIEGIRRRTKAALALMHAEAWDLFLVVYGEAHSAGHGFWHLSDPDHPLYVRDADPAHDPLLNIYMALDDAVGTLRRALPADACIVLFSQEGMKTNSADVPSWVFLPELLYRWSFDGREALAKGDPTSPLPPMSGGSEDWIRAAWAMRANGSPLVRFLERHAGLRASWLLNGFLGREAALCHPLDWGSLCYMPQLWYAPSWPRMKAFALPSFSEGNVRINVRGRENKGIVAAEDFAQTMDEIAELVADLKDARTGRPIVREIIRERATPFDNPSGPDADLVFLWQPDPADTVDSAAFGRIGPVPLRRSGDHYRVGFFAVSGPGINPGALAEGDLVDFAPTILELLDIPRPNHLEGRSRVAELAGTSA
jgi:predicted AlkP superfamily phosphohydrolase/phosphomutase